MRTCISCGKEKDIARFGLMPSGSFRKKCFDCRYLEKNKRNRKRRASDLDFRSRERSYQIKWISNNKDRVDGYVKKYRSKDPIKSKHMFLTSAKKWRTANPEKVTHYWLKRRLAKTTAVPAWLTKEDLEMIAVTYAMRVEMTKRFGYSFHVDHIIPLQGENVCGLHVPANLRVVPASLNIAKSNKFTGG
jgi:hypothetical protein